MNNRRVVITGLGAVTPIGNDLATFWENCKNGVSGIAPLDVFDTTGYDCRFGGQVRNFDPKNFFNNPKDARRTDRFAQLAMAAAKMAMTDSGVDTETVVRTGMIGFLEGAMIHGIFHGDLHGGNLFVMADGRTALLDFGIVGRLGEERRLAFLRLLLGASMNDVHTQMAAIRDLGALPADTDLDAVIADLGLDKPAIDPTQLSPEELTREIQQMVKSLLGYGARLPKELMLFVKNLVFLDGAIATLAPDLDLFGEIATISMYFATTHGERIAADVGLDPERWELDITGMKASFGVDPTETERLTYRELQERREVIRGRLAKRQNKR